MDKVDHWAGQILFSIITNIPNGTSSDSQIILVVRRLPCLLPGTRPRYSQFVHSPSRHPRPFHLPPHSPSPVQRPIRIIFRIIPQIILQIIHSAVDRPRRSRSRRQRRFVAADEEVMKAEFRIILRIIHSAVDRCVEAGSYHRLTNRL